jgi:hypothetical protein
LLPIYNSSNHQTRDAPNVSTGEIDRKRTIYTRG